MHVVGLLVGLAVKIDYAVLDLQGLSGKAHTPFHIVLPTVCWAADDVAIFTVVVENVLPACGISLFEVGTLLCHGELGQVGGWRIELLAERISHLVVVGCLVAVSTAQRVAGRVVEHYNVVELHMAETFHSSIVPVRPLQIRLAIHHGQRVLGERHGERRLGDAWTIAYFAHEEIVAGEQGALK